MSIYINRNKIKKISRCVLGFLEQMTLDQMNLELLSHWRLEALGQYLLGENVVGLLQLSL